MPETDGRDATRAIRQIEAQMHLPHVPIVALTAHAMEGDAGDIMAAGLDHYMTKPLRKSALVEHIIAHCPAGTFAPLPPACTMMPQMVLMWPRNSGWAIVGLGDQTPSALVMTMRRCDGTHPCETLPSRRDLSVGSLL